jgi:hypothetical protein
MRDKLMGNVTRVIKCTDLGQSDVSGFEEEENESLFVIRDALELALGAWNVFFSFNLNSKLALSLYYHRNSHCVQLCTIVCNIGFMRNFAGKILMSTYN